MIVLEDRAGYSISNHRSVFMEWVGLELMLPYGEFSAIDSQARRGAAR